MRNEFTYQRIHLQSSHVGHGSLAPCVRQSFVHEVIFRLTAQYLNRQGEKSNLYSRHSYVSLIKYFIEDNRIKFLFPYATGIIVRNENIILVEKKKKSNSRRVWTTESTCLSNRSFWIGQGNKKSIQASKINSISFFSFLFSLSRIRNTSEISNRIRVVTGESFQEFDSLRILEHIGK